MKQIKILPSTIFGKVKIISSKSLSHRYLICAALSKKKVKIENIMIADDIDATISVLKNLDVKIEINNNNNNNNNNTCLVFASNLNYNGKILDVRNSGSTLRFFIPLLWGLGENLVTIKLGSSLAKRPLDEYFEIADKMDYKLEKKDNLLLLGKKLKPGNYFLKGNISSQFISGLLFALPLLGENSKIIIEKNLVSTHYINLTLDVLKKSGIKIEKNNNEFLIAKNQKYNLKNIKVEGDFSQAAFFIVIAVIKNVELKIEGLNKNSLQGDKKILEIIQNMGVEYYFESDILTIKKHQKLVTGTIDLANIPDLGPILFILAGSINETTIFTNYERLIIKESNRLAVSLEILKKEGVEITFEGNFLKIKGVNEFYGNKTFDSFDDHRIVMALSVYGICSKKGVIINNYQAVEKSYPNFFDDLKLIGGKIIKWLQI